MSSIEEVVEQALAVLARRPSALVTDVDGTLSRIVPRPEDASVSPTAREALSRLVPVLDLVAVITGREQAVARRMVGVDGLTYIGSYALTTTEAPAGVAEDMAQAIQTVQPALDGLPGVTLEVKDVSFALHYRNCDDPEEMRRRVIALLEPIAAKAHAKLLEGKAVMEVAPLHLPDKGTAFAHLTREAGTRGAIFIGDDLADTAIFREIGRRRTEGLPGLAIGVVDGETPAAVYETSDVQVGGVDGVEALLSALADRLAP